MSRFLTLLHKDIAMELRRRETLSLIFCLALILCAIVSVGINASFLSPAVRLDLTLPLVWVISVLSATVSIGRSFDYEFEHNAMAQLILSKVPLELVFLSKSVSNFAMTLLAHLIAFFVLPGFLGVLLPEIGTQFLLLSALVLWGYSCLGTLLGALSAHSRMRAMLLPLLLLPLLFPLFFAAVELSIELIDQQSLLYGSIWFSLLLCLDVLYTILGMILFSAVVKE